MRLALAPKAVEVEEDQVDEVDAVEEDRVDRVDAVDQDKVVGGIPGKRQIIT